MVKIIVALAVITIGSFFQLIHALYTGKSLRHLIVYAGAAVVGVFLTATLERQRRRELVNP